MSGSVSSSSVPNHLGLILDGNRRWAKLNNTPTLEGHRIGYDNLKTITKQAFSSGVNYISAYVFSTENWNRSREEVGYLMDLLLKFFKKDCSELNKQGVRILWLGNQRKLNSKILKAVSQAVELTKNNTKGTLALCFNYGGYDEIVEAVKKMIKLNVKEEDVTTRLIRDNLFCPDLPDLDLVIRTSGEQRISNFMLWRIAYSELYFSDKFWPEFTVEDIKLALEEYANRGRRFGK